MSAKEFPESADLLHMAGAVTKICDPEAYRLGEAIQKAKSNALASPGFEVELVRFLQARCLSNRVPLPIVFRGLEVLGGMLDGGVLEESRLITLLRPFLRSSDPQIASKSVLVLGRQSRSLSWLNSVMAETDDRIRANLIESLWKRKEPEVEKVLRNALADPHPRVAANAVHGLFLLGVEAWMEGLERLVGSKEAAFRISGIWMLKASAVPDAPARIKLLIRDADAGVRHAAFEALIHIRENGAKKAPAAIAPAAA
jgi:HEAT repeat protein